MKTGLLRATFYLPGCNSLKEKRQRLAKLRDKFGKQSNVAVCESSMADELRQGEWTFVAVSASAKVVQQTLAEIERFITQSLDAEILNLEQEWLV